MELAGADVSYLALGESGRVYACRSSPLSQWDNVTVYHCQLRAPVAQVLASQHRFYIRDEQGVIYSHPLYIEPARSAPLTWQVARCVQESDALPYGASIADLAQYPLPAVVDAAACAEGLVVRTWDGRALSDMVASHTGRTTPPFYPLPVDGTVYALDVDGRRPALHVRTTTGVLVRYSSIHSSFGGVGDFSVTTGGIAPTPPLRLIDGRLYYRQYPLQLPDVVHVREAVTHDSYIYGESEIVVLVRASTSAGATGDDMYCTFRYKWRPATGQYELRNASHA